MTGAANTDLLELTATVVTAHLGNNEVETDALPTLIRSVYRALASVGHPGPTHSLIPEPAVPIRKSVFPDYIVCLEDGRKLTMLTRHLKACYSMTPADYREKWRLPASYPMVAPNYSSRRSSLAKETGLGRNRTAASKEPEVTITPARRARGSKV